VRGLSGTGWHCATWAQWYVRTSLCSQSAVRGASWVIKRVIGDTGRFMEAALVNGIVSGHLCGPSSTLGAVRDEQVQRQLFHYHPVDTQAQMGSP
jgi:hypothetical protein